LQLNFSQLKFCNKYFLKNLEKFQNLIDEKLKSKKIDIEAEDKNEYNFMNENKKEIDDEMKGDDENFLPLDKFYDIDRKEVSSIFLPYETIDVIIFINIISFYLK